MNRLSHLLWVLSEECAEVAHRCSKAARFGLGEIEPEQDKTNAERIEEELHDLFGAITLLEADGHIGPIVNFEAIADKKKKVEKFLKYSEQCGTLTND